MICINCSHGDTTVTNSRPSKKSPSVWRRRTCPQCKKTFTTYEQPSLSENKAVQLVDGGYETFNLGRLTLSISQAFSHDTHQAKYDSFPLAQTVANELSRLPESLTVDAIAQTTYRTLRRVDELAAVQYAARHHLISSTRRRGRPSLS